MITIILTIHPESDLIWCSSCCHDYYDKIKKNTSPMYIGVAVKVMIETLKEDSSLSEKNI